MVKRTRFMVGFVILLVFAVVISAAAWPIKQACTPGFFKNHPQFITGGSCIAGLNQDTLVSAVYAPVSANSCVGKMSLLGVLSAPSSACGSGNTLDGAEVILLRQSVTRVLNGTNSFDACNAVNATINITDQAISYGMATNDLSKMKYLAQQFDALDNDSPCTIGQ